MALVIEYFSDIPPQDELSVGSFKASGESGHDLAVQAGFVPSFIFAVGSASCRYWLGFMDQMYVNITSASFVINTLAGSSVVVRAIDTLDSSDASVTRGESGASAGFVISDLMYEDDFDVFFTR